MRWMSSRACGGKLLGVFVAYQGAKGAPARGEAELLQHAANLAALAIALRSGATARLRAALAGLDRDRQLRSDLHFSSCRNRRNRC